MAITDGVAQQDRAPYALRDGYFLPRERSLADHLSLAADLAAHVRAVGRGGGDAGDWTPMFEREPATWLARLIAFPLETRRAAFETALTEDPAAAAGLLRSLAREILRLRDALAGAGLPEIAGRIDAARSDPRLGSLLGGLAALGRRDADGAAALAARAAEDASAAEAGSARSAAVGDVFERARAARRGLALAHEQLLGMIEALRPAAERAFAARLGSGEIEPAVALAIAERELLAEADARINRFVARHRDFYHRTILGQSPRAAAPETILLRFLPAGGGALIEEGETVEGRGPGDPAPQRFRLLNGVAVTTAEVAEARILVFQRDPQISRQRILGYVTGVRATVRRVDDADARRRLFAPEAFDEATIGLEIESDMLRLAEGRRRVEAALTLRRRANVVPTLDTADAAARRESVAAALAADRALAEAFGAAPLSPIVARIAEAAARCDRAMHPRERLRLGCLACAETPAQAQAVFGGLVAETLVEDRPWPTGVVRRAVLDRLRAVFEDGRDGGAAAAEDAEELFAQTPREVFQQFLGGGFTVSLSTAEGFHGATTAKASPNDPADGPGFRVRLALDETAPPIAPHGGAAAPALRIHMAGQSLFCPFSLFEPYALKAVRLSVSVRGLRRLTARGEDGPIDVGQPFRPFGAIPKDGAAFTVGAPELAVKPVTRIEADILWGGLPRGAGGFAEHYRGYGEDFPTPRPQLAPAYLSPGGARPLGPPEPMIADAPGAARLEPRRRLSFAAPGRLAVDRDALDRADGRMRSGALRLSLVCGPEAFGHAAYPGALAASLRPSLNPFRRRAAPEPPYAPEIAEIALGYDAEDVIDLDAPSAAPRGQRVRHLAPFGAVEAFPARTASAPGPLPERIAHGAVMLRIAGPRPRGPLSLLFDMEESSHRRLRFPQEAVTWRYLSETGWRKAPAWSVISDSTDGLMRSGVVRLDPPGDAVARSDEMPGEGLWIAATAEDHLADFPLLETVSTNGARAIRDDGGAPAGAADKLVWRLARDAGRVAGIRRLGETFGGAEAESAEAFHTRVAERLRHRRRAVTLWDVERLALEHFPVIWKAKCFPAMDARDAAARPGAVTLVVVPFAPERAEADPSRPRMFDVLTLARMEERLRALAPACSDIVVSNPRFDRIQVRARVGFSAERDDGSLPQRLERDLSRMLSVWTGARPMNGFGWSVGLNDVAGFIRRREYVSRLVSLSMLQLSADDDGFHTLGDTARETARPDGMLRWSRPWSLPLPTPSHWIETSRSAEAEPPAAAGVGALAVGEMLVVGAEAAR